MKTMSAEELEAIGVPFDQDVILDMWHDDEGGVTVVFKLEDNYYGISANLWEDQFHWYSFYENSDEIPLIEMERKEVTYIRYFPVSDNSIETR